MIATPGQVLSSSASSTALSGTFAAPSKDSAVIRSSLCGSVISLNKDQDFSVEHPRLAASTVSMIPSIGAVVTGVVTRITPISAYIDILSISDTSTSKNHPFRSSFKGIIRLQDVRSFDKDHVKIVESFRPRDIVRCLTISLGDANLYYLSTARDDLGVVVASCSSPALINFDTGTRDSAQFMIPIAWDQMQCPQTGTIEHRKVAKPSNIK
jgi:exosome complex RNA-binding protein Csl4